MCVVGCVVRVCCCEFFCMSVCMCARRRFGVSSLLQLDPKMMTVRLGMIQMGSVCVSGCSCVCVVMLWLVLVVLCYVEV